MTDLLSYLLPYPTVFSPVIQKLLPVTNLPSKLIVTALSGQFKKVISHYRPEGVSIQSYLQLDLDSHIMVLQQLLFQQLTRERRNKNWCQYISTGLDFLKSIQLTAFSWHQISKSSGYIFISIQIFQLMWNICDCFFSLCSLSYCLNTADQEVLQLRVWAILLLIYFGHKSSTAFDSTKIFSITSLVILLWIQPSALTDHQAFLAHLQYFMLATKRQVCVSKHE
jgi:hypothetical protein